MSKFNLAADNDVSNSLWGSHKHYFKVAKIIGLGYGVVDINSKRAALIPGISIEEARKVANQMNDIDDWCDRDLNSGYRFKVINE